MEVRSLPLAVLISLPAGTSIRSHVAGDTTRFRVGQPWRGAAAMEVCSLPLAVLISLPAGTSIEAAWPGAATRSPAGRPPRPPLL